MRNLGICAALFVLATPAFASECSLGSGAAAYAGCRVDGAFAAAAEVADKQLFAGDIVCISALRFGSMPPRAVHGALCIDVLTKETIFMSDGGAVQSIAE
jgi:hypothetical protein